MPLDLATIASALEAALAVDDHKLGFLCHTGKFEDWLRDEASFALQVADPQTHVAREHENMDVVVFDSDADGVTVWQMKHAYSINQWHSNGASVAWPPRRGPSGWHGDYHYRLSEDLQKARTAATKLRTKVRRSELPVRIFLTYAMTHLSGLAASSTPAQWTQKYSSDFLPKWLKDHGAAVGGFDGLRTSSAEAVQSWSIEGQPVRHDRVREPLPGPSGLTYALMSFTWGPYS
jgi:hypothetical protein